MAFSAEGSARDAGADVALSNAYMTVSFDRRKLIVRHVMHRHVYGDALRQGMNAGLDLLKAHRAVKWLSDDRLNGPLSPRDAAWLEGEWEPRSVEAGWKYWALVEPVKVLGRMNMRLHVERVTRLGVTVQAFDDPLAAERWLDERPVPPGSL